jgi:hypothetical protein
MIPAMSAGPGPTVEIDSPAAGVVRHSRVRYFARSAIGFWLLGCALGIVNGMLDPEIVARNSDWIAIPAVLGLLASAGCLAGTFAAQLACWFAPRPPARVRVDPAGVRLARAAKMVVIPRAKVVSGWGLRTEDGPVVELRLRNGDMVHLRTRSEGESEALLAAAGLEPGRRVLEMRLGSAMRRAGRGLVVGACPASVAVVILAQALRVSTNAMGFTLFGAWAATMPLALALFGPPSVSVGVDGVAVTHRMSRWFVSWRDVAAVYLKPASGIHLVLHDGRTRFIATAGTSEARERSLYDRIREFVAAAQRGEGLDVRAAALDRNGRTPEAWREALRALGVAGGDYRHATLTPQELRQVLDDPRAPAERRVAAAYALAAAGDGEAKARVRVAVEASAHEPLRVALERAAEGELDDELVEKLNAAG